MKYHDHAICQGIKQRVIATSTLNILVWG